MNRILKKGGIWILSLSIITGGLSAPFKNTGDSVVYAETKEFSQAQGINVAYRTEDEIREYLKKSGATISDKIVYKEKPVKKAPYKPGVLSDETLDSAIRMTNQIRYIAGLSHNLIINNDYVKMIQAGSLVNSVNSELTHLPEKPADMDDALYQLGYKGTSSSNLGIGYRTINDSLVHGYMYDGNEGINITTVGHRRWILNPAMAATGFGAVDKYSGMYAFDLGNPYAQEYGVMWPAQTMPTDYFGEHYPWSISMGYPVDKNNVKVTLTRLTDNRTWIFSNEKADGAFNVDNGGYGQRGCIIFRPEDVGSYGHHEQFQVNIEGLGNPVSYQVTFFDLIPVTSIEKEENVPQKIEMGSYFFLSPIVAPSNASNTVVKYTSSNEKVITVEDFGMVDTVSYGTATITATSYSSGQSIKYKFTVVPPTIMIDGMKAGKKQLTVYHETDKTISGYEIVYATNDKFTKNKKVKLIKKTSNGKTTITGLKSGQRYHVRVRAYYEQNGKKVYGAYSQDQSISVK